MPKSRNIALTKRQPAPDCRATTYRWQHADRAPDPAPAPAPAKSIPQRLRPVTQTLAASGRLGPSHHAAGQRWLRDYELGVHGARADGYDAAPVDLSMPLKRRAPVGGHDKIQVATIDAIARNRDAARAVGVLGYRVLVAGVADCLPLTALALAFTPVAAKGTAKAVTAPDTREVTGCVSAWKNWL